MIINNKNSLWSGIQHSASLILSLVGLKLNLITFGDDIYGIWILLLSIWGFGSVLDLGFGISLIRFIAISRDNVDQQSRIVTTSLFIYQVLGLIIVIVCSLLALFFYFSNSKIIPAENLTLCKTVFYILAISFYFQYISNAFRSVIEGFGNYVLSSKIMIFLSLLNFLFTFLTFAFNLQLLHLAFFYLFTGISQFSLFYLFARKSYPKLQIRFFSINIPIFKEILKFSASVQITYLLGAIIDPAVKYIIGIYASSSTITTYEIARKFSQAASSLFSVTFRNMLPMTSVLKTKQEYQDFLYTKGVNLTKFGIFYAGFFYGIIPFAFAILFKYFYNNEDSLLFFYFLALAEAVNISGYLIYIFLLGLGKAVFLTILQGSNVFLTAVFLILGFSYFNNCIGLTGYFISVVLGNIFMFFLIRKYADIKLSIFFKNSDFWKLLSILLLFVSNVVVVSLIPQYWFLSQISVSFFCFIIFIKNINEALKSIKQHFNILPSSIQKN